MNLLGNLVNPKHDAMIPDVHTMLVSLVKGWQE